jgi:hypothetical protein
LRKKKKNKTGSGQRNDAKKVWPMRTLDACVLRVDGVVRAHTPRAECAFNVQEFGESAFFRHHMRVHLPRSFTVFIIIFIAFYIFQCVRGM